jgi:hypothetical protein
MDKELVNTQVLLKLISIIVKIYYIFINQLIDSFDAKNCAKR